MLDMNLISANQKTNIPFVKSQNILPKKNRFTEISKQLHQSKVKKYKSCENPTFLNRNVPSAISVRCGKCNSCKECYTDEWTTRAVLESLINKDNIVVNLTFTEENYPESQNEAIDNVKKFIKKVRRYIDYHNISKEKIKCDYVLEYGKKHGRMHFHIIIFGFDFKDRYFFKKDKKTQIKTYRSEKLEKLWKYGFSGINVIDKENPAIAIRYVKKYLKKGKVIVNGKELNPVFKKSDGIGYGWIDLKENREKVIRDGYIDTGNYKAVIPKGIRRRLREKYPEDYARLRENECKKQYEKTGFFIDGVGEIHLDNSGNPINLGANDLVSPFGEYRPAVCDGHQGKVINIDKPVYLRVYHNGFKKIFRNIKYVKFKVIPTFVSSYDGNQYAQEERTYQYSKKDVKDPWRIYGFIGSSIRNLLLRMKNIKEVCLENSVFRIC